jgi:MoxR-like ATPase
VPVVAVWVVVTRVEIVAFPRVVRRVPVADVVPRYGVRLVRMSRPTENGAPSFIKDWVSYGASVRAAQALILGSKARALLQGRTHVSYDDVRALALPVLRHRILLNFQAQSEKVTTETLISKLVAAVPTPRAAL